MKIYLRYLFYLIALSIIILCLGGFFYFLRDEVGSCLSDGKVWDDWEKRCREDCLTWNSVNGCIYIDDKYQRLFTACADKTSKCDEDKLNKLFIELCHKYHAPLNIDDKICDFEFSAKDCFKLEGNWQYPDICFPKK